MSVKALGIALKLTLSGMNQLIYPQSWAFGLVVVTCVLTQMNYLNKVTIISFLPLPFVFFLIFSFISVVFVFPLLYSLVPNFSCSYLSFHYEWRILLCSH
jgi:hypothetical protein